MIDERWQKLLQKPGALPVLPEVLIKLRAGLCDLDVDMDDLCRELQCDAALVAEIIKNINSPLFGVPKRIESLKQAVILLGLRRVRGIILSQSLRQSLATYQSPGFALFNWWDRSLLNAVSAAMVCQRAAPDLAEEAYLAGLVADLGILVLARFEPGYEQLLKVYSSRACEDLWRAEPRVVRVSHTALAADVFEMWRFPATVIDAVRSHHDLAAMGDVGGPLLPRAVYFASLVTDCVVTEREDLCQRLATMAAEQLFIGPEELAAFVNNCLGQYRDLAGLLGHGALAQRNVPRPLAAMPA